MKYLNPVTFNGRPSRDPKDVLTKDFSGSPMAGQQPPLEPPEEPEEDKDTGMAGAASQGQEEPPGASDDGLPTVATPNKRVAGD
jgi:hypothetical protein